MAASCAEAASQAEDAATAAAGRADNALETCWKELHEPVVRSAGCSSETGAGDTADSADIAPALAAPDAAAGASTAGDAMRPTGGGALDSLVWLVVLSTGGDAVCLTPEGMIAHRPLRVPFTAGGRKQAVSVAEDILLDVYGLTEAQAPLLMAGVFPKRVPVEYVVAALAGELPTGRGTSFAELSAHLTLASQREHAALAIASVRRLVDSPGAEAEPLPAGCLLGVAAPRAVAVESPVSDAGVALFEERRD